MIRKDALGAHMIKVGPVKDNGWRTATIYKAGSRTVIEVNHVLTHEEAKANKIGGVRLSLPPGWDTEDGTTYTPEVW